MRRLVLAGTILVGAPHHGRSFAADDVRGVAVREFGPRSCVRLTIVEGSHRHEVDIIIGVRPSYGVTPEDVACELAHEIDTWLALDDRELLEIDDDAIGNAITFARQRKERGD